jgi:hypothetical protein
MTFTPNIYDGPLEQAVAELQKAAGDAESAAEEALVGAARYCTCLPRHRNAF